MTEHAFPVIDLFAGPGGLGEGFSSIHRANGEKAFNSLISIEQDTFAHQTLHLRHFVRSFANNQFPKEYYDYLEGSISREKLFEKFPDHKAEADKSALKISLGEEQRELVNDLISERLGSAENWVLIGGPPCQAYSLVGRSRMKNNPDFEADVRHFLYKEYLNIIADHAPPIFVMENVKGLLSAKVGTVPVLDMILADLRNPRRALDRDETGLSYQLYGVAGDALPGIISDPKEFIVKSEDYGIPQARHRMFIVGVRNDIQNMPSRLQISSRTTVSEVIGDLPFVRSGISKTEDSYENWLTALEKLLEYDYEFEDLGHDASLAFKTQLRKNWLDLTDIDPGRKNSLYRKRSAQNSELQKLIHDPKLKSLTGHETRGHMPSDLQRYFFMATFAATFEKTPKLKDFPDFLLPAHKNIDAGRAGKMFSDRFRVQLPDFPATTITSHISKDGHYFIHYDAKQCRSFTVREAARLQTFPDNYKFEGPRTSQYHQIGNAVPVFLARQIGEIILKLLNDIVQS